MSEYIKFKESIQGKSANTIKSYYNQYNKLRENLNDKDIMNASQKLIILISKDQSTLNSSQSILNIGILVKRLFDKPTDLLERQRNINKEELEGEIKEKNKKITNLPTYDDLIKFLDKLYEDSEWTKYIINYLIIHYQVRNLDLIFEIIKSKKQSYNDKTKNYIWYNKNDGGKAVYIRNAYKTASTYKQKVNTITDKKFITALRRVMACQKNDEKCGIFIDNIESMHYHIQKQTYKALGEGLIFKIVVNHFKNDFQKIREISNNRGTNVETIMKHYDIENV